MNNPYRAPFPVAQDRYRLRGDMPVVQVIAALSDGNPGAVRVLLEMLEQGSKIDPQGLGGLGAVLSLDTYHIYGSRIWMLYKDVCGQDLTKLLCILRARQLGFVDQVLVDQAIGDDTTRGNPDLLDQDDLLVQVKNFLPDFGVP